MQTDRKIRFPLFQCVTEIGRLSRRLERDGFPRLQMMLIVTITGGIDFLASFAMLHAGLAEIWIRYLCAIGISYLVFLLLLRVWMRTTASDYADAGELANLMPSPPSSSAYQRHSPARTAPPTAAVQSASSNLPGMGTALRRSMPASIPVPTRCRPPRTPMNLRYR